MSAVESKRKLLKRIGLASGILPFLSTKAYSHEANLSKSSSSIANVKDFGATGDGITDDTIAIQSALDSGSGSVYIPAGTYLCKKLHILDSNPSGITIYGDGKTQSIILSKSSGDQSINIFASSGKNTSGVTLRDLRIDGNSTATTVYFYRCTNLVLQSVEIRNHIGKNVHIERSYQVNVTNSVFIVAAKDSPECALYSATNGITLDGECYFQTEGAAPGVIINENEFGDCLGVVIKNNVFEVSSFGIQVTSNINTSGIVIDDNYFELLGADTAKGIQFSGGLHNNVSIKGNHFTEVITPLEILAINSRSNFDIVNNRLYRPIVITTIGGDTTKLAGNQLPALNIGNQKIEFSNSTYVFDIMPTVIVDSSFAFSSLNVENIIAIGLDTSYNRIRGRFYHQSQNENKTNILTWFLPSSGGTRYAFCMAGNINVIWRSGPQSITGVPSTHVERHHIDMVARNTGTAISNSPTSTISTTNPNISTAKVVVSGLEQTLKLQVTGQAEASLNEWIVDFDINYVP